MRLIDADALKLRIDIHGTNKFGMLDEDIRQFVDNEPTADVVERKKGEWLKISPAGIYECSACGQTVMTGDIAAYKYCHGCGARMGGTT